MFRERKLVMLPESQLQTRDRKRKDSYETVTRKKLDDF